MRFFQTSAHFNSVSARTNYTSNMAACYVNAVTAPCVHPWA